MTGAGLVAAIKQLGGVVGDLEAAAAAGFANLDDDLVVAEDVATLLAPFVPAAGLAAEMLPALGLVIEAAPLLNVQGGVGQNLGAQSLGKLGER